MTAKIYISDEDMKVLLYKYPFLKYHDNQSDETIINNNYYKYWDGTGWETLWKTKYMPRLFKEYDNMSDEDKKCFRILDTKQKYGTLRCYTNKKGEGDLETILEWVSECTCEVCGTEPRTVDGYREIWQTRNWITNMCKDCARKYLIDNNVKTKDVDTKLKEIHIVYDKPFAYKRFGNNKIILHTFKETSDGWLKKDSETELDPEEEKRKFIAGLRGE